MSTLEALNAISEAIEAHKALPEVQRQLKEARESHDFVQLELEEANAKIAELRNLVAEQDNRITELECGISDRNISISELRDRNTMLDNSLQDAQATIRNQNEIITEQKLIIESDELTNESLRARLADSKSYGERLAETLKSIGAKIVAAVEVPEVTSEKPFPVSNPVAVSSPTDAELDSVLSSEPNPAVADSSRQDMVESANSPGCYTSPITPAKPWWER